MGTDIYCYVEQRIDENRWEEVKFGPAIFDWRSYRLFGWLAGVRNYSCVGPLVPPRGLPSDRCFISEFRDSYYYTPTWYLLSELLAVNYSQTIEDLRTTVRYDNVIDGACTGLPGEGRFESLEQFLGEKYIGDLKRLVERARAINCPTDQMRLVMWFDC